MTNAKQLGLILLTMGLMVHIPAGELLGQASSSHNPTREELQERLDSLYAATGDARGDSDRSEAIRQSIAAIETRLQEGDFRPGDVVSIRIAGDTTLSGTFTVGPSKELQLPRVENVPLDGVLYSELNRAVEETLGKYFQDPQMTVRPLKRVAVLGGVRNPGFYTLPPSSSLADVLMAAGGPTQNANINKIKLERGEEDLLANRNRDMETLTLREIGVQRGDRLYVPTSTGGFGLRAALGILGGVTTTAFALTRIF